ncbi:hypothetical protein D3C83_168190 [compost metagenome]
MATSSARAPTNFGGTRNGFSESREEVLITFAFFAARTAADLVVLDAIFNEAIYPQIVTQD